MASKKRRVVAERSFGRVRIAVTQALDGTRPTYEVIHHPTPMDRTSQPGLFYSDGEAEALTVYEEWCEAEVQAKRARRKQENSAVTVAPEPELIERTDLDGRRLMRRVNAGDVAFGDALDALELAGRFPERVLFRCIDRLPEVGPPAEERATTIRYIKAARSREHLPRLIRRIGVMLAARRDHFDPWVDLCRLIEFVGELGTSDHVPELQILTVSHSESGGSGEGSETIRAELERAIARCERRQA